jgi:hypothetical protein
MQNSGEDTTDNTRVPENGNTSDKVQINLLDLEIHINIKNNKSPGYDIKSVNLIKAVGPTGMQWLSSGKFG